MILRRYNEDVLEIVAQSTGKSGGSYTKSLKACVREGRMLSRAVGAGRESPTGVDGSLWSSWKDRV